ncbi:unnamed protein product [Oikopleura dioica]|uniref:C-type lectin domain-containing protein n=1 Tax=Oikopleura dioica TaxID=34765 RepID=E4XV45_OIKDI|nr:unnamed protein product [Oikopleura dioica]
MEQLIWRQSAFGQQLDAYQSIWFGLSVNGDENNPAFVWDDNLPVDYTNWAAHQPAIQKGDNCGYIDHFMDFPKTWEWKMSNNCESKRNFICKLDKYTITAPDNDAPAHLGSPIECENGWNSLDGGLDCFKTFGKEVIYAEARRSCLSMDSSVASIHDLTINLFVKSLLSTDTSAHLKSAWIGAERTKTGAWKWMDGSNFVFSNFVTDNSDDGNAIIGVDGRWESQDSNSVNGYICSKMKKFENCLATSEIHHCPGSNSGTTEQHCYELGCCWDVTKTSHCFSASADSRKSSEEHTAGFAAGITAMVFIIMYAAVGGVYYFVKK